jgi:S1-C subfamily serine protease
MLRYIVAALVVCVLTWGLVALADTLILKDGSRVEATSVMKVGNQYRVKTPDGQTRTIPESQVKQIIKGGAPSGAGTGATGGTGAGTTVPPKGTTTPPPPPTGKSQPGTSSTFANTKAKAESVDAPIVAVSLWEKFIDSKPAPPDLEAAKAELAKWQQLQKDNAERINGKWVGGEDRKKLLKQVDELITQGAKDLQGAGTVQGIKKLEDALKIYPNSFEANFTLGYYYLTKGAIGATGRGNVQYQDKAIKSLEAASRILPTSAATWSNLAIGYNFRSRYVDSVQAAYKAAKIKDDKDIVQNLVNSIAHAPGGMQQNNAKIKPIMEDAVILASKHGIDLKGGNWRYIPVDPKDVEESPGGDDDPKTKKRAGVVWMGSAFFITEDGYLITNHHVATGDPKSAIQNDISFRVRFDDGTEKNAELIAVDDAADIALMKVKTESPVPFLKIADDNPKQASKALVLGYPATGEDNPSLQISEGQVKSVHPGDEHEVWFDLNTTHGNSGGPIVDRNCRVVAILTGGREVYNVVYVLGVGPKQIQRFLEKIGEKAPKIEYVALGNGEFDGEKLTEEARKSTLLVLAIRGAGNSGDGKADADNGKDKPAEGAGAAGAAGADGAGASPGKVKE